MSSVPPGKARASHAAHEPADAPQTHYQALGLDTHADARAVRAAHRALVRRLHPDVNPAPDAHARFTRVQHAYEVLSDPQMRAAYDRGLAGLSGATAREAGAGTRQAHYSWSNIAGAAADASAPGAADARAQNDAEARQEELEEFWALFFAPRAAARARAARAAEPDAARATDSAGAGARTGSKGRR